jgi:hypothetical protein
MIKVQSKIDFTTNLTANEFNGIVVETANIIDFTQISPSGAFNTGGDNQMDKVIKFYAQTNRFFAATGGANAITLSTPAPRNSQKAYYDYMEIAFIAPFSNTNACTINIDGLGVKSLKNLANADLVAGNIVAGDLITAFYNGISFLTKITPRPTSIVKFAVNDASQDAITAEPNFITATGTKEITVDGSAVPIQGTYYEGSAVIISNSQSFDTSALNLATARIIIVEEGIINFNVLDSIITESHLPPTGGVDGNYWIQTNPLKTYKRIGGVWTLTRFVKLGEYPTSASGVVGTIRCYGFNGIYNSGWFSAPINTNFSLETNLGTLNVVNNLQVSNSATPTAVAPVIADTYSNSTLNDGAGIENQMNTTYITTGNVQSTNIMKATGAGTTLVSTPCFYRLTVTRNY